MYAKRGYETLITEHGGPVELPVPLVVACAYGARHTYPLGLARHCVAGEVGSFGYCIGVRREVLAGRVVAYEETQTPCYPGCFWRIIVRDLRSGRMLHREPTGTSSYPGFVERAGVGEVAALVVRADGAVAWTVKAEVSNEVTVDQVHLVDGAGSRIIAAGNDIDLESLALAGSTLYWTQGGMSRTELLR